MSAPLLFIIPSIATGGAELQLTQQLKGLRRRGLRPRLMVLSDQVEFEILNRSELPDHHVIFLGMRSAVLDRALLWACPGKLSRAADFTVEQGCTDIVALLPAAHFFARLLKIALLGRRHRVRLFQYHHSEENLLNPPNTFAKRLFFRLNHMLARRCDHVQWHVSEGVRADISGPGIPGRDVVLSNTCDLDSPGDDRAAEAILSRTRGGGSPYVVLLPGRLLAIKGHDLLIDATYRLVAEAGVTPDALRVLFAGDGPARARIESAVTKARLQDYVTLLGNIPHPILLTLFGKVDLVVVPSLVEGFGIVAIEALSRGALLIASDAAGLDEIVRPGENALQFRVGDVDALYRLMRHVWERRGEAIIDREAARTDVRRRFGLDAHLDRMLALLGRNPDGGRA